MKQTGVLDNACGVIACLHSIFNYPDIDMVEPNSVLAEFISICKDKDSAQKA
jgi:hypothetical protein